MGGGLTCDGRKLTGCEHRACGRPAKGWWGLPRGSSISGSHSVAQLSRSRATGKQQSDSNNQSYKASAAVRSRFNGKTRCVSHRCAQARASCLATAAAQCC
jgi:hypothetical protein